jgi:hypothetical protein
LFQILIGKIRLLAPTLMKPTSLRPSVAVDLELALAAACADLRRERAIPIASLGEDRDCCAKRQDPGGTQVYV